jgi:hypothetical protein
MSRTAVYDKKMTILLIVERVPADCAYLAARRRKEKENPGNEIGPLAL